MIDLLSSLPGAVAQGLIWGIMAVGVYITYKLLDIADLTVDGSICTGAAVCTMMLLSGRSLWLAVLCAVAAGLLAGIVTGLLHIWLGIPPILAGILTQMTLWSVNLKIMGKANQGLSVRDNHVLLSQMDVPGALVVLAIAAVLVVAVLYLFFGTELGCGIRATGCNPVMSRAQGINTDLSKVIGLSLSNGLVALSGALLCQYQGYADINMGRGAVVIGLAAVVIGEAVVKHISPNFAVRLTGVLVGAVIYYLVYQVIIFVGFDTDLLKMFSALVVAAFLGVPYVKKQLARKHHVKGVMLEMRHVTKIFNPGTVDEKIALNDLSFTLNDGDFVTVIGGNGAGKSTMQNAICGTWLPDAGEILLDGIDLSSLSEHQRAKYLGRVYQDPMTGTAAGMQIEENLALAARRGLRRTLRPGIRKAEREEYRQRLQELGLGLDTRLSAKVGTLSGGQRQALTLLMATLRKPKLLLLDEHTAALDPKTAAKVMELTERMVTEEKLSTLMITHNMRDAIRYGNRLIMLHAGRIILDISGQEKKDLTVPELLEMFARASGDEFSGDRAILA